MATTRIQGRGLWADDKRNSDPVVELLVAVVKQAHKDVERVTRLGDKATPGDLAAYYSAEQFLQECRQEFVN